MCSTCISLALPTSCFAITGNIPKPVQEFALHAMNNDRQHKITYIMKWKKYKVYYLRTSRKGIHLTGSPKYILYNGKQARFPTIEEDRVLQTNVRNYCNVKQKKNYTALEQKLSSKKNKTMEIKISATPPEVPSAITEYADKYMLKGKDREIFYLTTWNDYQIYRVYWKRYGFLCVPSSIILYDGSTIRRPTQDEFKKLRKPMNDALEKRAIYLGHQDNKD